MPLEAVLPVPSPTIMPLSIGATASSASGSTVRGSVASLCSVGLLFKADPLCEFEPASEVYGDGLASHVRFPRVAS